MGKKLFLTLLSSLFISSISLNISVSSMKIKSNDSSIAAKHASKSQEQVSNILNILEKLNDILEKENSLLKIKLQHEESIYMIGDIHGNICSFNTINKFMDNHPNDKFIFLGDYVDKEMYGTEVFMRLANLKIKNPDKIYLLRGNHEVEKMNKEWGFYEELMKKFPTDFNYLHKNFNETFNKLPLAAVIDCETERIFCVHGGICPYIKNSTLKIKNLENLKKSDPSELNEVVEDILWSDPKDIENDFEENDTRGVGYIFGKNATNNFLSINKLDYIIRAHEFAEEGFKENFYGLVKTVFSAANYCNKNNKGAILEFDNSTKKFFITKFGPIKSKK